MNSHSRQTKKRPKFPYHIIPKLSVTKSKNILMQINPPKGGGFDLAIEYS
jgi:hypothetical protein